MMQRKRAWAAVLLAVALAGVPAAQAQDDTSGAGETSGPDLTAVPEAAPIPVPLVVAPAAAPATDAVPPGIASADVPPDPGRGAVTNLPLPRYVTLKTGEGNARRGPGLTHRIDWVFTRVGMPLRITAEYEHWRRVEDAEGAGGWVHYALLSGARSVLVAQDMVELHIRPDPQSDVVLKAERGVVARLLSCLPDWCRLNVEGEKGWVPKAAVWGVDPGEVLD